MSCLISVAQWIQNLGPVFHLMTACCLTALTSPIEYQRNHVGAPSAGSSVSAAPHGIQGNAMASGPQQGHGSRRPSRIPQPSRLPQPLRHHPGADGEGPGKMSGTRCTLTKPNHCSVVETRYSDVQVGGRDVQRRQFTGNVMLT